MKTTLSIGPRDTRTLTRILPMLPMSPRLYERISHGPHADRSVSRLAVKLLCHPTMVQLSIRRAWASPAPGLGELGAIGPRMVVITVLHLMVAAPLPAQDLDPRAYANIPVNSTLLVGGFSVSRGGVVSDPTLPDLDQHATVETPSLGVGRSFSLFGQTAQAFGALPYSWAQGSVLGGTVTATRAGLADMRIRLSVLVRGAPATSVSEFAKSPRRTILGTSLTVVAPTGEFFPNKLFNVGTNRWAFKPEVGISQPIRQRWLFDMYAGLWLFGANDSYFPGTTVFTQAPMGAFQMHLSYNLRPQLWAALDATYYVGGRATRQGVPDLHMQSNSRFGATLVLPVGRRHSVKLAASRGAIIRYGPDFSMISIGWQTAWVQHAARTDQ